jgi:ferredoxin
MKKVIVDDSVCIGCGFCYSSKPEIFNMNDEGYAFTKEEKNNIENMSEEEKNEVIDIVEGCPVEAIKIVEEEKK